MNDIRNLWLTVAIRANGKATIEGVQFNDDIGETDLRRMDCGLDHEHGDLRKVHVIRVEAADLLRLAGLDALTTAPGGRRTVRRAGKRPRTASRD